MKATRATSVLKATVRLAKSGLMNDDMLVDKIGLDRVGVAL